MCGMRNHFYTAPGNSLMKKDELLFDLRTTVIHKMGKDLLAYLPAKAVPALIGLISIPVFTRIFDPDAYGLYTLIISTVSLLVLILFSWLFNAALRYYNEFTRQGAQNAFVSTIFLSWLLLTVIGYGAAFLLYYFGSSWLLGLDRSLTPFILLLALLMAASQSLYHIVLDSLRANRHSAAFAAAAIILPLGRLLATYFLAVHRGMGVEALLISSLSFEAALGLFGFLVLGVRPSISAYSADVLKRALRYGLPLAGTGVLSWLLALADRFIIGFYHGTDAVGVYAVAYNLAASSLQMVFMALMLAAFPVIIQTWNLYGQASTEQLINTLTRYYCLLTFPLVAGITVLARPILAVLTTDRYAEGFSVLPWVAAGLFFLGYSQYVNKVWELKEKTGYILLLNLLAVGLNVALNFLFVPRYGYTAAGITTMTSYAFYVLLSWVFSKRYFALHLNLRSLSRTLISVLIMSLSLGLLKEFMAVTVWTLALQILAGLLLYLALLWLTGEGKQEMSHLAVRAIRRKRVV